MVCKNFVVRRAPRFILVLVPVVVGKFVFITATFWVGFGLKKHPLWGAIACLINVLKNERTNKIMITII